MKLCKDCNKEELESEFYGIQNECKDCTKERVRKNYSMNRKYYSEYEKKRQQDPERRKRKIEYQRDLRKRNPEKYKARMLVGNSLRNGKIKKGLCEICGIEKTQAHHTDYSKPLQVMWLCRKHHMEVEGKNSW
jgi:hypothetical protein